MAEIMQMNANLVGAAAVQSAFDQTDVAARPQDPILGLRGATLPARDAHPLPVNRMPRDCLVDHARCLSRGAGDECEIDFSHRARGKLSGEIAVGRVVFCDDESAAGFLVEPVHDPGPSFSADAGTIFAVGEERVHQSTLLSARTGMHNPTGRLAQYEYVLVLENDLKRR